jgi:hypothetical protein
MRIAANEPQPRAGALAHARLSPRLPAGFIDVMAMKRVTAAELAVAAALRSSALSRLLGSVRAAALPPDHSPVGALGRDIIRRWQARLCGHLGRRQTT